MVVAIGTACHAQLEGSIGVSCNGSGCGVSRLGFGLQYISIAATSCMVIVVLKLHSPLAYTLDPIPKPYSPISEPSIPETLNLLL